jgi:signal transduction histidine kinase/ActR/RegA family two-component response regulator
MKVQTKITLLLVAVVATFFVGLFAFRIYDRHNFRRVAQERFAAQNRTFDDFSKRYNEPIQTLAAYDSSWTQMVQAIATNDTKWFEANVTRETLDGYNASAIWVCRTDFTVAYSINRQHPGSDLPLPLPAEAISKVFSEEPYAHFFSQYPEGVMEIRGATVVPSVDGKHQTKAHGYLFVGSMWNKAWLKDLEKFTGSTIDVVAPEKTPQMDANLDSGSVVFSRLLAGWDGKPIAGLVVRNDSPIVRQLNRSNERLLLMVFVFALVLMLLVSTALVRWVHQPLSQIMESLSRNDLQPIERMAEDKSEFGALARTIHKFFEQSDKLIREMQERRATEEALRKSEEELRHSQKMEAIGRLAGGVAHDFNNLLTAIIGYAELIAGRTRVNPHIKQNAELILKAGEQAATLTKQLLAFSRKQMMQPKVIDLNDLVIGMEKLLRRVIGERFDLRSEPEADNGRVRADPSQIEQVVLNLGVNARDAMPTGGTLTIRTANVRLDATRAQQIGASLSPGDYVELSVTDTGCGMDEETRSRIFEPFFTTKGPGKGTGLGLATVYGIVRQSGGAISVESEMDKGSTFRIFLPRESAPLDFIKESDTPVDKSRNFETVLVVEDEEIVRELVCDVLEDQGYRVLCAPDGIKALEVSSDYRGKIHLLVTDVIMPHMNGHELATRIASGRPDMKILYVSGYSDNDIGDQGVLDPRHQLLQKPFTPQTLARKIREVMRDGELADTASK